MPVILTPGNYVNVKPFITSANTWVDVDLINDCGCPANVKGGIFLFRKASLWCNFNVRKNGSTDTGNRAAQHAVSQGNLIAFGGCDANGIVEVLVENIGANSSVYLVGWFVEGEVEFFDNIVVADHHASHPGSAAFYDLPVPISVPAFPAAKAVLVNFFTQEVTLAGRTDFRIAPANEPSLESATLTQNGIGRRNGTEIIPLDSDNKFRVSFSKLAAADEVQIVGYVTGGYERVTPAYQVSTSTTLDSWQTVTLTGLPANTTVAVTSQGSAAPFTTSNGYHSARPTGSGWPDAPLLDRFTSSSGERHGSLHSFQTPCDSSGAVDVYARSGVVTLCGVWTELSTTLVCEDIAAESYVQTTRVFSPDDWSNVVSASFAVPLWSNVAGGSFIPQSTLAVDNIAAASAIDPVSITTQYTLEVASISAVSSLDPVGITSQHTVEAASIAAASAITPVSITSQHVVEAASLAAASAITPVSISTQYRLEVASVAVASAIDPVGVTSQHFVEAASIAAASYLTEVRLPSGIVPIWSNVASDSFVLVPAEQRLTVDNIASVGHITPVAVDTEHHLVAADVAAESHIDPVSLATEGRLGVAPIAAKSHITPVRVIHTQRLVATSAAAASHIDPVAVSTAFRLEVASVAATSYVAPVAVSSVHLVNAEDIRAGPHLDPVAIASTQWLQVNSVAADSYAQPVFISVGLILLPIGFKPVVEDISDTLTAVYTGDTYVIMDTGSVLCVADVTDTLLAIDI